MAPKKNYTADQMGKAVQAVQSQGFSVRAAANKFGVPRITLHNKISGKSPLICGMGPSSTLTQAEEEVLVNWIIDMGNRRCPITKDQLLDSVQKLVTQQNRSTPFTSNRPGKKWYAAFLNRHHVIAERMAENLSAVRDAVTEEQIKAWFQEIQTYANDNNLTDILEDPSRIFNTDESGFFLSPKPGRVLVKKGIKNAYMKSGDEKENVTVLLTANAAGKIAPPMIVYAYDRIPANIAKKVPAEWAIGKSDSGWMCGETFFEYVTNVFNPWLIEEGIQKTVLLFVDGHKSHMTLHLSNFCSKNGIEIIALYPNSTHILQPMDIAVFRPLKVFYRKAVVQWKMENNGNNLKKEDFAPVLKIALESITENCIKNGFRGGGLYPFGPDYIDYSKIRNQNNPNENTVMEQQHFLNYLESQIVNTFGQDKLAMYNRLYFEGRNVLENMALDEDMNLYILWAHNKQRIITPNTNVASTASDNYASPSTSQNEPEAPLARCSLFTHQNIPEEVTAVASEDTSASTSRLDHTALTASPEPSSRQNTQEEVTAVASEDTSASTSRLDHTAPTASPEPLSRQNTPEEGTAVASEDTSAFTSRLDPMAATSGSGPLTHEKKSDVVTAVASEDTSTSASELELTAPTFKTINNSDLSHTTPEKTKTNPTIQQKSVGGADSQVSSPFTVSTVHAAVNPNKNGCTPQKIPTNVTGLNVPSPFKKCLFWPEDPIKKKSTRKKDKVPSAVTSQAWQKYHQNKEEEKRRVLQEKELRAKQRLEKKIQKQEMEKERKKKRASIKKRKVQESSSSEDTDMEIQYNESDDSEYNVQMEWDRTEELMTERKTKPKKKQQNKTKRTKDSDSESELTSSKLRVKSKTIENKLKDLKKGCFVIIRYEGEYFPGKIENKDKKRYEISTMTLSTGNTFRWPERPDIIWYESNDIIEIINTPVQQNNRGIYKVSEMDKYLPDLYNYTI